MQFMLAGSQKCYTMERSLVSFAPGVIVHAGDRHSPVLFVYPDRCVNRNSLSIKSHDERTGLVQQAHTVQTGGGSPGCVKALGQEGEQIICHSRNG